MNNPFSRKLLLAIVVSVSCITAGCDNSATEKKSNNTGIVINASRNEDSSVDQVEQSDMLEMLETIEQLDHLDFQDELSRLNDCLEKYDLSCAKKHLKRARLFAKDKGEKGQLLAARESIKGTALLIEAGEYIADESFSSARDRIQQAQAVKGNSVLAALLQKTESHYENAHTAYTERKEREARERREQATNNSNSGSTHHSRTIGRFTSCRQLTASCEDHCNNRSNKAYTVGPFFLRESDRDTCVDKCHTLEIDCDGGALNEYVLRHYYCQAIYTGASNAYELGKRCENNFSFWQF